MPDLSKAWLPTIRLVGAPEPIVEQPALALVKAAAPEPIKQAQEVSFIPHRGSDNLIYEIVANEGGITTWTFAVERDENNLIVEVVAMPEP